MSDTVFFSWQSDRPTSEGRNFIERALEIAVKSISRDIELQQALRDGLEVDKDTKNVPGSPKIFETILEKIERATVFVPDFTFVANRPNGDPTPNPNVLIEYGYALKCKSNRQFMPVMNTAYGEPKRENMPFDLIEHRNPITYELHEGADEDTRKEQRNRLVKDFESALRTFFGSDDYRKLQPRPDPVRYREPENGRARFRRKGDPIGISRGPLEELTGADGVPLYLTDAPAMWLRVMPQIPIDRPLKITEISNKIQGIIRVPFLQVGSGIVRVRDGDGCGYGNVIEPQKQAALLAYVFTEGEIWLIDAWHLGYLPNLIMLDEKKYADSLTQCAQFLNEQLNIPGPYRWVAGMENVKGRYLTPPDKILARKQGPCGAEVIEEGGVFGIGDNPVDSLEPFFEKIYDQCNVSRPNRSLK